MNNKKINIITEPQKTDNDSLSVVEAQVMRQGNTALRLLGDGNKREFADYYPTPAYATEALLSKETFDGEVWEPACGGGHISKVLIDNGYKVKSTDIIDYGYGEPNINFLRDEFFARLPKADNIITNPPFMYATEFVYRAKEMANKKIAMFLKTTFLEGVERYKLFQDQEFPLKAIYQFSRRIAFGNSKNGGMLAFAWFVWEKQASGRPYIDWLP